MSSCHHLGTKPPFHHCLLPHSNWRCWCIPWNGLATLSWAFTRKFFDSPTHIHNGSSITLTSTTKLLDTHASITNICHLLHTNAIASLHLLPFQLDPLSTCFASLDLLQTYNSLFVPPTSLITITLLCSKLHSHKYKALLLPSFPQTYNDFSNPKNVTWGPHTPKYQLLLFPCDPLRKRMGCGIFVWITGS